MGLPNLVDNFLSPRDFHTPNIRTDVEKNRIRAYISNEF